MSSRQSLPVQNSDGRRIYVFATVGLAVFLLGIVAAGYACHGFMTSAGEPAVAAAAQEISDEGTPSPAAEEAAREQAAAEFEAAKGELEAAQRAAQQEYLTARQASSAALSEYEAAQSKFLDFVGTHFGELTADIPAANTLSFVLAEEAAKKNQPSAKPEATATPPKPAAQTMVANPLWAELRDQLETLQKQRKKLLVTLTPAHPAVVAVDLDIAEIEQKLQTVPAQIAANQEPAEQNQETAANTAAADSTAAEQQESSDKPSTQPAGAPAIDLAAWAARWGTENAQFQELAQKLSAAKEKYRQALQHEASAGQRQAEAAAAVAALAAAPSSSAATRPGTKPAPTAAGGANPWRTIPWCGLAGAVIGLIVARGAMASERVFRAAAAVRQALELPVLGLMSRGPSQLPREQPQREPRWVRRTVLTAELWLAAIVVLLAATAVADQQFWRELIADPLSACSRKFFC